MIAAYCRVSTARQKVDSQIAEISKCLKANGYNENEVRWYIDKESGKTLKRPEFERLQADIFSGRIKTVVCWKLDRLSRRLKDGVVLLAEPADGTEGLRVLSDHRPKAGATRHPANTVLVCVKMYEQHDSKPGRKSNTQF